ncbi:MAG: thiamine pyrophosphate-dependent enzyme [Chitinophagales bacterium]
MKTIAEVIALALDHSRVKTLTCVPCFGGSTVFDHYCELTGANIPFSLHPEVAFSVAYGTSLTGKRAATLLKPHAIMKAMNSLTDAIYTGVNGGLVSVVFNDHHGRQSDTILDIIPAISSLGLPYHILYRTRSDVYLDVLEAFEQSEKLGLPYFLFIEATELNDTMESNLWQQSSLNFGNDIPYERDIARFVLCPPFAAYQQRSMQARVAGSDIESIPRPVVNPIPGSLPEKWQPAIERYNTLFSVFRDYRVEIVTGDVGISSFFAFPPYDCVDITTYMGGSIPLAIGASLGKRSLTWAVTGDFAFAGAGHLGLLEARQRGIPIKVLLIRNGKSETTGGQPVNDAIMDTLLCGYQDCLIPISDPNDVSAVDNAFKSAVSSPNLSIVIADYR